MAESRPSVQETVTLVMEEIGPISKTHEADLGKGGNYLFRGIEDMLNAGHPAFVKHKLVVTPERSVVSFNGNLVYVTTLYRLTGPGGDWMHAEGVGAGNANQSQGAAVASSNAYKTAMFQAFSVPVKDSAVDGEQVSPGEAAPLAWPPARYKHVNETLDLFPDPIVDKFWTRLSGYYGQPVRSLDEVAYSEKWDNEIGKLLEGAERAVQREQQEGDA